MPLSAETIRKLIAGLKEERKRRKSGKSPAGKKSVPAIGEAKAGNKEGKKKLKQVPSLKGVSEEPI